MEAEFIRWLKATLPQQSRTQAGIGDDCSTMDLAPDLTPVITTDALVDQVHFDIRSQSLRVIGRKSLAVNLSDIAAMGATPVYAVVSLISPRNFKLSDLQELYTGILTVAEESGTLIIGGDFNSYDGPLIVSITAIGTVPRADIKYRFGSNGYGAPSKKEPAVMPAIQALSATPANRDVRVHDWLPGLLPSVNGFCKGVPPGLRKYCGG